MRSNFDHLEKAKILINDSMKLSEFHEKFAKSTEKGNKGRIDKYKKGFNADDRFKSFSANVYFSAYTGSYGSSSVGSAMYLNGGKDLEEALVEYLSRNEEAVIKGMANILDEKAKSLISAARTELEEASSVLSVIESYSPQSED